MILVRLSAFAAALALVFAAAAFAGSAFGPEPEQDHSEMDTADHGAHEGAEEAVPGLAAAEGGLRLELARSSFQPSAAGNLQFTVLDAGGEPVTDYEVEHERAMHLIVVRRDFAEFQHLHPRQDADGTWSATADLSRPGTYRVFADFATPEQSVTLGSDLFVAGEFDPQPLPASTPTADAAGGYAVTLTESGEDVSFTVTHAGEAIEEVEPYLGADGHLVALREGDLAFLHTHPTGEPGGPIEFGVEYPSPGRYRLFLQFKHRGEVRTAAFTTEVSDESSH